MQKIKILLDIDDTLINSEDRVHPKAHLLFEKYEVVLFSASEEIKKWADLFNVEYISKHDEVIPEADVLIDDDSYFVRMVKVDKYFKSIDDFLDI